MDDNTSRILKMLEEGKITAAEAATLISALGAEKAAPAGGAQASAEQGQGEPKQSSAQSGQAKNFEFSWGQKKNLPFDLGNLGKQISDAVRKIDPEKIVREARTSVNKGGKRWQDRLKHWSRFLDGGEGPPENTLNQPTARATETLSFELAADATVLIENEWGSVTVTGGGESVEIEVDKEAWAATEDEAQALLRELKVEAAPLHVAGDTLASRLEVRVRAPEGWAEGLVHLRVKAPELIASQIQTTFGEVRTTGIRGNVAVNTVSGSVSLADLGGEVRAEGISGDMSVSNVSGPLHVAGKSGDIKVSGARAGADVAAVSGDIHVSSVEGGSVDVKSVSGDVNVSEIGVSGRTALCAESVSGSLSVSKVHGNVSLKSVSGDIHAGSLDTEMVETQTVSGDIQLWVDTTFAGTAVANTVSGDVEARLPADSSFRFTLGTQSGSLECELEVQDSRRSDTVWTGAVGLGAGTVTVQTRSGDVRLRKPV